MAFPALLFAGVPAIVANATTSLGLWPSAATSGWVYRKEITTPRRTVLLLVVMSLAGGFAGAAHAGEDLRTVAQVVAAAASGVALMWR